MFLTKTGKHPNKHPTDRKILEDNKNQPTRKFFFASSMKCRNAIPTEYKLNHVRWGHNVFDKFSNKYKMSTQMIHFQSDPIFR